MRIVPRPRQVSHIRKTLGLLGCVDADAPHLIVLGALSTPYIGQCPWLRHYGCAGSDHHACGHQESPASAGLSFGGLIRSGCREPLYPKSGRLFFFRGVRRPGASTGRRASWFRGELASRVASAPSGQAPGTLRPASHRSNEVPTHWFLCRHSDVARKKPRRSGAKSLSHWACRMRVTANPPTP
jgi:hypothetical protein